MLPIFKKRALEKERRQKISLIGSMYRAVLGREPDPEGLHVALQNADRPNWADHVLQVLLESDERRLSARNEALRVMVGPSPGTVVSLGSSCHMASILGSAGWRTQSFPFDWIFSDWRAVIDILDTDFRDFLDTSFYEPNLESTGTDRVLHRKYGVHPPMFQHHDVHRPDGHAYLIRCVDRLRALKGEAITFAATSHADRLSNDVCAEMVSALQRYFGPQIVLLGFAVARPESRPLPQISERWEDCASRVFDFVPVSSWRHTQFEDPIDDAAILRTISAFGRFGR
ncbi:Putative papain-like cysteine peptidase [Rhizobium sp. RU20A]|uniref:DUF1796 family putative cysteine peptidase n=1 Tax=Rhizobium sp. RU20A TaxID=1907412 RepID=UPI000955BCAE|nr:DUF1796 family putative cysteine peptidase [Rhizobium sp. RU20A]SIQ58682.1 Putative papain-like cysteine peptidase [Rhizobium sp. RU20A]